MGRLIAQAGNTVVPAVLAVESLGYEVVVDGAGVLARRGDESYLAEDLVALLGLVRLVELRSWEWRANDDEIPRDASSLRLGVRRRDRHDRADRGRWVRGAQRVWAGVPGRRRWLPQGALVGPASGTAPYHRQSVWRGR
jgi:hypothetical protein